MMLIGVDYHPSFQTIAFFMEETGEYGEQELKHSDGQAEKFYRWSARLYQSKSSDSSAGRACISGPSQKSK